MSARRDRLICSTERRSAKYTDHPPGPCDTRHDLGALGYGMADNQSGGFVRVAVYPASEVALGADYGEADVEDTDDVSDGNRVSGRHREQQALELKLRVLQRPRPIGSLVLTCVLDGEAYGLTCFHQAFASFNTVVTCLDNRYSIASCGGLHRDGPVLRALGQHGPHGASLFRSPSALCILLAGHTMAGKYSRRRRRGDPLRRPYLSC
jgi:hypothetical protein